MWILLIVALVILILVIVIVLQPAHFTIQRSILMNAPPEVPFAHVNDLHKWEAWNPFSKMDPNQKTTYEGPGAGPGAAYAWSGNNKAGEGKMTIIEARPNELVRLRLEFTRPMKALNTVDFTFTPEAGQTRVAWIMRGTNNFIGKAVALAMNMDKMVGPQFEQGLADMKTIVEADTASA